MEKFLFLYRIAPLSCSFTQWLYVDVHLHKQNETKKYVWEVLTLENIFIQRDFCAFFHKNLCILTLYHDKCHTSLSFYRHCFYEHKGWSLLLRCKSHSKSIFVVFFWPENLKVFSSLEFFLQICIYEYVDECIKISKEIFSMMF